MIDKPPIGLIPEIVFEEDRQYERIIHITEAMGRYATSEVPIPEQWTIELNRRIDAYRALLKSKFYDK